MLNLEVLIETSYYSLHGRILTPTGVRCYCGRPNKIHGRPAHTKTMWKRRNQKYGRSLKGTGAVSGGTMGKGIITKVAHIASHMINPNDCGNLIFECTSPDPPPCTWVCSNPQQAPRPRAISLYRFSKVNPSNKSR